MPHKDPIERREYARKWSKNNKDKIKLYNSRYSKKNGSQYHKEWREKNKQALEKYKNSPIEREMYRVRWISRYKISLKGKKCKKCGSTEKLNRHHSDYNKPLKTTILCLNCHAEWHSNHKPIYPKL